MLVLSRKANQSIMIGSDIRILVVGLRRRSSEARNRGAARRAGAPLRNFR